MFEEDLRLIDQRAADCLAEMGFNAPRTTDFTYRHSLPYLGCSRALNHPPQRLDAVVGCLLAYSYPLMGIDIVLDGGAPIHRRGEELWRGDLGSATATAMLTNAGYALVSDCAAGLPALIAGLAIRTLTAMTRDLKNSYDVTQYEVLADVYWNSSDSRLFGSAVNELMFGAACLETGQEFSPHRRFVASGIGRLRQAADELMDVREDARRGLVTLPVVCALSAESSEHRQRVASALTAVWGQQGAEDSEREGVLAGLVMDSGAPLEVLRRMRGLREDCLRLATSEFSNPEPIEMLVEQRWLQAKRAVDHGLCDPPPHLTSYAVAADPAYGLPKPTTAVDPPRAADITGVAGA
ncbi:hypothetical protein ACFYL6_10055 [Micromonospora sp. NPDC007208]|uniref:hypothetical protein n=1 Tax=Micromonospora sp. NPDC007208 TaxID=3364236 RepID=UPI0036CBD004